MPRLKSDSAVPAELLTAARSGSSAALAHLLAHYQDYLTNVARRELDSYLRPKAGGSDLVQQTLLEARQSFGTCAARTPNEFQAWLRTLLANNLRDLRKHYRRAKRRAARERPLEGSHWQDQLAILATRRTDSGLRQLRQQEACELVEKALARLPPAYRQVIIWRWQQDLSYEAIAAKVDRSAEAVRKLCSRALRRMAEELVTADGDVCRDNSRESRGRS